MKQGRFLIVGLAIALLSAPALAASNSPQDGGPKSSRALPKPSEDSKGGYGDAPALAPVPADELISGPRETTIGESTLKMRTEFGFVNSTENIKLAKTQYAQRLVSGTEVAFFPTTDAEHALFKRWLDLIDDRALNTFIMQNQAWFAEKENSLLVANPSARFLFKQGTPKQVLDSFQKLLPAGLDAQTAEVRWSGDELESLRTGLAEEAAAMVAVKTTLTPEMRRVSEEAMKHSTLLQDLERRGVSVVWVRRTEAQVVSLIVNTTKSRLRGDAVQVAGKQALTDSLNENALPIAIRPALRLEEGTMPVPMRAERESDPGQIKAGLQITIGQNALCTSNVAINYAGATFLVTAGHCVVSANAPQGGQPNLVGNVAVPYFHDDTQSGVTHNGLYIGNLRWFQYNWATGYDIALVEMVRQGSPTNWPEIAAGGLATGLFTLTPDVNQIMHYGYGSNTVSNPTYVCFEGASPDRINVIGTNSANGRNGNRCGPVRTAINNLSMQEITGPFSGVCEGDSGGLVHSNGSPVGIVAYGSSGNGSASHCGTGAMGYSLMARNLAAYSGASIDAWPSGNRASLEPESAPGRCVHRHANGNTGAPNGGWLQQVPSIYFPSLQCYAPDANKLWRLDPANYFTSGDVYTLNSYEYCMHTPNGWPQITTSKLSTHVQTVAQ